MKNNLINLIFFVAAYSVNAKIDTHSNVLLLDSKNFEKALKSFDNLLVDFYLPDPLGNRTVLLHLFSKFSFYAESF